MQSIGALAWRVLKTANQARKELERAADAHGDAQPAAKSREETPKEGTVIRLVPEEGWRRAK